MPKPSYADLQKKIKELTAQAESMSGDVRLADMCQTFLQDFEVGLLIHQDGKIIYANEPLSRRLGHAPAKIIGKDLWPLVHPDDRAFLIKNTLQRAKRKKALEPYKFRATGRKGKTLFLEGQAKTVEYNGQSAVMIYLSQITEGRESDLAQKQKEADTLKVSEEKFRKAFATYPDPLFICTLDNEMVLDTNQAFLDAFKLAREDVIGVTMDALGIWGDQGQHREVSDRLLKDGHVKDIEASMRFGKKSGSALFSAHVVELEGFTRLIATVKDVTHIRRSLQKTKATDAQLEMKSRELEEVNDALRKLLQQGRQESTQFEQRIVANVEDMVIPYVRRLKATQLDVDQQVYVNVVESNLSELVEPFMRKIGDKHAELTPREIEVANLVRMGATSKEIARLLNISKRAVEFHRDSLRKKLGLKKSKRNLRAYLASLS